MKKPWFYVSWALRIGVLLFFAYKIYLQVTTGQSTQLPLVAGVALIVFVGIPRILSIRSDYQGSDEDKKQFNTIFWRSVVLSILIMTGVVIVAVLTAMNR